MRYNISYDICATAITLIALYSITFRRDLRRPSNRIMLAVLVMHFLSCVFDIWSTFHNSYTDAGPLWLRDFTNYAFLFIHTSEAFAFLCFLLSQLGLLAKLKRWQIRVITLPWILLIVMPLAVNPFLHTTFYYDHRAYYRHGPLMVLLYVGALLYMTLSILLVAKMRDRLTVRQRHSALALLVLSVTPIIIQSQFMQKQLIELFFQALGINGYLSSVENIDERYHPETRVLNRHALIRDTAPIFMNQQPADMLIVKLSQIEYLRISALGSEAFHGLRLTVADWLRDIGAHTKLYDCERGVFTILIPGKISSRMLLGRRNFRAELPAADKLACLVESRFLEEWQYQDYTALFPTQLTLIHLPDDAESIDKMLEMITLPYVHTETGVKYADGKELLQQFRQTDGGQGDILPPDLQESLDNFLKGMSTLTPAERNITELYINGYEVSEIPEKAFISMNTVKKHNKNIYRKLGISSRDELMLYVDLFERCGKLDDLYM